MTGAQVGDLGAGPRCCVVGAGAIGGLIGARLSAAGIRTSALARGQTLAALRRHGWRLRTGAGPVTAGVHAEEDPAALGPQDVVILATKAHALPALAPALSGLLHPDTVVVPAINGVPWWFFDGLGGPFEGLRVRAVDPDGALAEVLPASRVLGCVVHLSAGRGGPGEAVLNAGNGLILGEPAGGSSPRLALVAGLLRRAGFEVTVAERIQADVWYKLWGNMTMNPISALTGAPTDRILADDLVVGFVRAVMAEAAEIGERIGCPVTESADERIEVARRLGSFRTSMLQDAEAGRSLELDALLTAVQEIGVAVGVATPSLDALLGLARLAARERGLYPGAGRAPVPAGR